MSNEESAVTRPTLIAEMRRLVRMAWPMAVFAAGMGIISGLSTAALLATVNEAIQSGSGVSRRLLLRFAALCVLVLGGESIAAAGNSALGQKVIAALRKEIAGKVACAPIPAIQRYRAHRLLATLQHDVDTISAFTFNFSGLAVAAAVTLGCLVYLASLSPALFSIAALSIALGLCATYVAGRRWTKNYEDVRDAQDELQKSYVALTEGAKELRMNRVRRLRVYRSQLGRAVDRIRDRKIDAMSAFWSAHAASGVLYFAAIGVIVALGERLGAPRGVVSAFALVLLYVKGPLEQLVNELPGVAQASISFRRVAELSAAFATPEPCLVLDAGRPRASELRSIELRGATYEFAGSEGNGRFMLGPIDLTIESGEVVFVTGENGCGKTTLLMLLLGLYEPSAGRLLLDGREVTAAARDEYRQLFAPVFFDYMLFEDLTAWNEVNAGAARAYLERFELSEKVTIEDGVLSTTDLSAGQRKRLALIQAYLEDRPVLVFDEWAAEQDPTFRRIFYTEIIPDLRRQGKTLFVISHDDRYFHVADRRITLRNGCITEDVRNGEWRAPARAVGDVN
ncbi:MAG TPA: cyclic peptide export ABC transporter [Polyangiaceae bacterium]|nr:cyclic peptide export ABC transporter [Polyangiaceae bacterium]